MQTQLQSSPANANARHRIEDFLDVVNAAVAIVSRHLPAHVDRDDLASAGRVRLVQLHGRAPVPFAEARAWLLSRVAAAMRDELRRSDTLGRRTRANVKAVDRALHRLQAQGVAAPSDRSIAQEAGLSPVAVRNARRAAELNDEDALRDVATELVAHDPNTPATTVEVGDLAGIAHDALQALPRPQRIALAMLVLNDATLADVARVLGCSVSGAAKHRDRGLAVLRAHPDIIR